MVYNPKPDGLVSSKTVEAPGQHHKQWVCKLEASTGGSGGSRGQTRPRGKTSANDEVEHDMKISPKGVAVEQNRAQGENTKTRAEAGASLQQQPN
jgi:CxxC motif-containing protein